MGKARYALVLGGAACVWDDVEKAQLLFVPDIVVACNHVGAYWPGELDHWCSYHPHLLLRWIMQRDKTGLPKARNIWTGSVRPRTPFTDLRKFNLRGGSSGMLATFIACHHAERAVLAGIPMDPEMPHFHSQQGGKPWKDGRNYLRHWREQHKLILGSARSMSGWTKELLGEPTEEWLNT